MTLSFACKSANEKIITFAVHDIRERSPLILTPTEVSWVRVVVKLNKMAALGNFEFPCVLPICYN